jgi:hypothetical protein
LKTALNILACKLLARICERREVLCNDVVADALDDVVDAISATLEELREHDAPDIIKSHLRAHTNDCAAIGRGDSPNRHVPTPSRPLDAPPLVS